MGSLKANMMYLNFKVKNMRETFHDLAIAISNYGNAALSKSLQYFGVGGSSVGAVSFLSKSEAVQEQVGVGMTLSDWGGIVGIIGGITLIIKNSVDMYFLAKRDKRAELLHHIESKEVGSNTQNDKEQG